MCYKIKKISTISAIWARLYSNYVAVNDCVYILVAKCLSSVRSESGEIKGDAFYTEFFIYVDIITGTLRLR